jgi:hypothetical protein
MRDQTRARNYSESRDEFRREHERRRAWGLQRRQAQRMQHVRERQAGRWPADLRVAPTADRRQPALADSSPATTARTSRAVQPPAPNCHPGAGQEPQTRPVKQASPAKLTTTADHAEPAKHPSPTKQARPGTRRRTESAPSRPSCRHDQTTVAAPGPSRPQADRPPRRYTRSRPGRRHRIPLIRRAAPISLDAQAPRRTKPDPPRAGAHETRGRTQIIHDQTTSTKANQALFHNASNPGGNPRRYRQQIPP